MARVELILRQSGIANQLDADLLIFDEHGNPLQVADSLTQIPEALGQAIENWQGSFSGLVGAYRGIKPGKVSYSSCSDSAEEVRESFRIWLQSQDGWRRLQNFIDQYVSSNEEVQINIQTLDKKLRLLPWNEVFRENHRYAETSISLAREFQRRGNLQPKKQVRILAVLGSCGGINPQIDIDFDYQQLEQTKARGAYIQTLKQPTAKDLRDALRSIEGWHIFFFAGHSQSLKNGTIGSVVLNHIESPLGIDQLKAELSIAIKNGLQIAIFNSCDGLGLANQLAELNLPQSIVMREPVPDEVAKDFLEKFLKEFSYNSSLFESVRRGREYLKSKWDVQDEFPGASWLPTIVRNPAVSLPQWNDLIVESPHSWKLLLPLSVITLVSLISLFLSLYLEFDGIQTSSRSKFIYYAQLYPHVILYPWIFLWGAYLTLYKAWCQIRSKPKLWSQAAVAFGVSIILLCVELTSDDMMLFELKEDAVSVVFLNKDRIEAISDTPTQIIDTSDLIDEDKGEIIIRKSDLERALENFRTIQTVDMSLSQDEKNSYYEFMKLGLSYSTWHGKGAFSESRKFYALTFLNIIAVIIATGIFWSEIQSKYVYNSAKYLRYVIATQLILFFWFPIRVHYNLVTKNLLFGNNSPVSSLDIIAYPVLLSLLAVSIYRSWRFEASFFAGLISLVLILGFLVIGIVNTNLVNIAFGLNSNPSTWILWPILNLVIIYLIYSDIFSKNVGV
ncbi:MAG: CHAT domain-containing protein [Symploca sp. SIO1C2]|nr:CHAT domain-containing protein [Symploca sp. SIO1C2]